MKTITRFLFTTAFALIISVDNAWACTVCKKNQPKVLQGITHGSGPDSDWDYLVVAFMIAIVLGTLIFSVKFLVKPGENSMHHIKNSILNPEHV